MAEKYVIDALSPFPAKWICANGDRLRVMTEYPVQGWLMVRKPGAMPFVIRASQLLNADKHPHGPFTLAGPASREKG